MPKATIVVVPRETFSRSAVSLASVLANTNDSYDLIYVDGCSPEPVREVLDRDVAGRGHAVLRSDRFLTPNRARNLALPYVRTPYVVFVDNDVIVSTGWLEALVRCADETGAWAVGPLCCEFEPVATRIHMAGGDASLDGRYVERHYLRRTSVAANAPELRRQPTGLVEFHTMLIRTAVFETLGPLDEGLFSAAEHVDLCCRIRGAGGTIFIEPDAVTTYVPPRRLTEYDRRFFRVRWSVAWNDMTIARLHEKWGIPRDDPGLRNLEKFLDKHRRLALRSRAIVRRLFGRRTARFLEHRVIHHLEKSWNRHQYREAADIGRAVVTRIRSSGSSR